MHHENSIMGKRVKLITVNGDVFVGTIMDDIYPHDVELDEIERIHIWDEGCKLVFEFRKSVIRSIEITS